LLPNNSLLFDCKFWLEPLYTVVKLLLSIKSGELFFEADRKAKERNAKRPHQEPRVFLKSSAGLCSITTRRTKALLLWEQLDSNKLLSSKHHTTLNPVL